MRGREALERARRWFWAPAPPSHDVLVLGPPLSRRVLLSGSPLSPFFAGYMIRSIPTITTDRIYCKVLGQGAVHGAFAGLTDFTVGLVNTHYVFLPTTTIIASTRTVDPKGRQWNRLKTAINQPDLA